VTNHKSCVIKDIDPKVIDNVLCANWTVQGMYLSNVCEDTGVVSIFEDAQANISYICNHLIKNHSVVHVGLEGAFIKAEDQECQLKRYYNGTSNHSLCVIPNDDITFSPLNATNEGLCGAGKSLLNVGEIFDNMDPYCNLLTESTAMRLAGGAILLKMATGCGVEVNAVTSNVTLMGALCADVERDTTHLEKMVVINL